MLPSLEENCPMVALESMAVGLPVAAARTGGTPDLVENGMNGLLFDPTDEKSTCDAALRLFNDAEFAGRMAAAGKVRAKERHHPLAVAQRHVEIYREALRGIGSRSSK
jgi:glycosyltransferase involved in cell wall biosynthesis